MVLYIVIIMIGFISTLISLLQVSKGGISTVMRRLILKRHVSLILMYVVCNAYIFTESIVVYRGNKDKYRNTNTPYGKLFIFLKTLFYS
jgi:hypothetical protein